MKSVKGLSLTKFKNFMATNRIAQVVAGLAVVILIWLAYVSISSLLSTLRSQSLLEAMANTLSEDYQQIDFEINIDNQATNFKLEGDVYIQGEEGIGADGKLVVNQVDQDVANVNLKFSSISDGQFVRVGDLSGITTLLSSASPTSPNKIKEVGERASDSWIKVSEIDDTCYRNLVKTLGDEGSELRRAFGAAYMKNPLTRVHTINTLNDNGREYYISPLYSNLKGFARDLRDSKAIGSVEGCKDSESFLDGLATMDEEAVNQHKSIEASTRTPGIVITVKDGLMTQVRSVGGVGGDMTASIEINFNKGEEGREITEPNMDELLDMDEIQGDIESIVSEAQQYAIQQQQQQQAMSQMNM